MEGLSLLTKKGWNMRLLGAIIIFSCGYFLGKLSAEAYEGAAENSLVNRTGRADALRQSDALIDESSMESFPASDAPSFSPPSSFH
jgi:hypothetical protein